MSNKTNSSVYFAADTADELVEYLIGRSTQWFQSLSTSQYLDKIKRSWQAYHGVYYENNHAVSFSGETGELVNLPVNHYRNIAQNMLTMVTATRPSFQARAVNTDLKSQIQTSLANGLLDYYMREKRLETDLKLAVEYAIAMGSGYIKMEWNATSGEIYDYVEGSEAEYDENGNIVKEAQEPFPVYEGDVEFSVLSPFDVVFDSTKETPKQDWQLCRTFKNKYDLAAKYPDKADDIKDLRTKSDDQARMIAVTMYDETVDVPVYEFFHRPTEALPQGRYLVYLSQDLVLIDTVLPYRCLPIFRIAPSNILGTPYGYTGMFDLLPLQEAVNSLHSTILTNNHTFGVQNIVSERGSGLTIAQLSGGLNHIEIDSMSQMPQALNFTKTAQETYNYVSTLEKQMEVISGINSVARGNPDPKQNLRSGNALALVQSQALQYVSGLQQSYIQLIEDVGSNLIKLLQDFALVPRIAYISGKSNTTYMKEFKSDDIQAVSRVIVDAGNALAQTVAGRLEMATQLIQMGMVKTPEEYFSVINTGKLETMTESQNKQLLLIRAENEMLLEGTEYFQAILTEDHDLHIREHQAVLADPTLKKDPALVQRTLTHIQEHINILSDPNVANILMRLGQQPIAPPMMPQQPVPGPNPADPTVSEGSVEGVEGIVGNPQANDLSVQSEIEGNIPEPARSPAPFENAPQTGQELYMSNIRG